ncbi:glycosyltransferase family 4 protein [Sphingosinicella humi]|nr:glycosyltransferase family 4 protein [Sphingosinicella humi]
MKFRPALAMESFAELSEPSIALLAAGGELWDDFLSTIHLPLERFCHEGPGGWMLGYMDALALEGVRTVLILFSGQVPSPRRYLHAPSGNVIAVLPAPPRYLKLRPYVPDYRQLMGMQGLGGLKSVPARLAGSAASHASTPWRSLANELRLHRCRALLSQEYEYFRFDTTVVMGKRLGLPVFATFQGSSTEPNLLSRAWKAPLVRRADGLIIAASEEIDRVRRRYGRGVRVTQIFNPVDVRQWHGRDRTQLRAELEIGPETCLVVWHGRIAIHDKGLDILLAAWAEVRRSRPDQDLRLMLMGTGEDASEFQRMIDEASDPTISWRKDYVTDREAIRRFLAAGDIYAFPSRLEGFAVAPVEAMACGLPVVAAAASGVPAIFRSESDGGLVAPTGVAPTFAALLGSLIDDRDRRKRLAAAARMRAEEAFSLEHVGRQLRETLLNGDGR